MLWTRTYADDDHRCSFCRRQEHEVGELINSPSAPMRYICASCVETCSGILEDRRKNQSERPLVAKPAAGLRSESWPVEYHYTPEPQPEKPRRKRR